MALDKFYPLRLRFVVAKRVILWIGLFLMGALLGFEVAWLLGFLRRDSDTSVHPGGAEDAVELTMSGTFDGSDRFIFTPDNVINEHGRWDVPRNVVFNGLPWPDLTMPPEGWADFAAPLDLRRARILAREGRDIVALEPTAEGFDLYIADTQMGAGRYAVTIYIPRK